jgi:hypothetical protein
MAGARPSRDLASCRIHRGAVYDAPIGLTASEAAATLITRDLRALPTYAALGINVELMQD